MTVFVTGASGGIGSAVVDRFTAGGFETVGICRTPCRGQWVKADLMEPVRRPFFEAMAYGIPFAVVHAAGVFKHGFIDSEETMRVNFTAGAELVGLAWPYASKVVMISSAVIFGAGPGMAGYAASKHAVAGFVKAMAQAGNINAVCPGLVDTKMVPNWMKGPGILQPESVAEAVWRLVAGDLQHLNGQLLKLPNP